MSFALKMFLYTINFPLSYFAAVMTFSFPLERRKHFWIRLSLVLALLVIVVGIYCIMYSPSVWPPVGDAEVSEQLEVISSLIFCSCLVSSMILTVLFVYKVPFREALYCAACGYLMEHMAYCTRLLLGVAFPWLPLDPGSILFVLSMAAVYISVHFLFVRRMVREQHYGTTAVDSVGLALAVLLVVMVMSTVASNFGFETFHGVYALLCCIYMLTMQLKHQEQLRLQQELGIQQQLWLRHKAQLEMSRENIDIINRKCHDLKHQVAALKHIQDPQKRGQVIESLQESVMIYDAILKTGNEILDTVLTEKSLLCSQNGIKLTCIAEGSLLSFMDAVDLYTLFGNALDNSIEAVLSLPKEERMIDLQVRQKAGLILIHITNCFAGDLTVGETLPKTSKEDNGYHGFGLKSIQTVAEKYGGIMNLNTEGMLFSLRIIIPIHR